jgi:transposase InsO family protein
VTTNGIEVDPEKVQIVTDWKPPTSVRGIQSFLGFCNFYRRFIKDYGAIARPLNHLTGKDVPFDFNDECHASFEQLKQALVTAPVLTHYDPQKEVLLETDASDGVIAGVLSQRATDDENALWQPVGYFSKTLTPAELNYQIHDKEMLAIVRSFEQWRADLARTDHKVKVVTDHKALEYFMTSKELNGRQARWAEALSEFFFTITYRPGRKNEKADALTRRDQDTEDLQATKKRHRTQQFLTDDQVDPRIRAELLNDTQHTLAPIEEPTSGQATTLSETLSPWVLADRIVAANRSSPELATDRQRAANGEQNWAVSNGLLLWQGRLVVPPIDNLRTELIQEAHAQVSAAHPGRTKTVAVIARRYWWKSLRTDVERYMNNCRECRRATVFRDKAPGKLQPLPVPERPWQHVAMDFKSYPTDRYGYDSVLVVIDRFSKQSVTMPCYKTTTAKDMAQLFIDHVYRSRGAPTTIVSDRGPQFISTFWHELCRILGVKLKLSTAFHPQTDGQTEIMNQYLDQRLRPFINYYQDNWSSLVALMDYAQLTLPHESLGMLSPFEVLNGYAPTTSYDWNRPKEPLTAREKLSVEEATAFAKRMHFTWDTARSLLRKAQERMEASVNKHRRDINFGVNDWVYVSTRNWKTDRPSKKLDIQNAGPYKILAQEGNSYRLQLPDNLRIHPVFAPQLLRKAAMDPLPGQLPVPEPPIQVTEDEEWEVEEILAVRVRNRRLQYRAKWVGYDIDPEWYPASNFKYSPHKLRDFHLHNPTLRGPPANLPKWIKEWEQGKDDYDELEGDSEASESLRASFFGRGG